MKYTLELHADAWQGERQIDKEIVGYRVAGLPIGEMARISTLIAMGSHDWRVMRMKGETQSGWTGNFRTPQEALAWLQKEIDAEQM